MLKELLLLSMANAFIATTVSIMSIFSPFREFVKGKSKWLGKMVSCGYCFGTWVSFFLVFVYRPRLFFCHYLILDYLLTAFVIAWLSAFQWGLMLKLLAGKEK